MSDVALIVSELYGRLNLLALRARDFHTMDDSISFIAGRAGTVRLTISATGDELFAIDVGREHTDGTSEFLVHVQDVTAATLLEATFDAVDDLL